LVEAAQDRQELKPDNVSTTSSESTIPYMGLSDDNDNSEEESSCEDEDFSHCHELGY